MGQLLSHPAIDYPIKSEIKQLPSATFERFLSFTCCDIQTLRHLLKSEQCYDDKFVYAYNSLRAYPLVRMVYRGRVAVVCPIPTLLFWRVTSGLYYALFDDPRFAKAFGDSFQQFAGEIVERSCSDVRALPEQEYGTKKARKASVDWIILAEEGSVIFLECKAKRLTWGAKMALENIDLLESDIETMADAVVQLYKTIGDYKDGQYSHFPMQEDLRIYPVVVTLEKWHLFGPLLLSKLNDAVVAKLGTVGIAAGSILEEIPYSLWSAEDLEIGMQIIGDVGIRSFMDGKIRDEEMKYWDWDAYSRKRFPGSKPKPLFFQDGEKLMEGLLPPN